MAKLFVKNGDTVLVITGKDKGKTGKVSDVSPASSKVVVEGVNIVSKHQKPKSQQDKGGIIKKTAPIEASNVMVICPACNKATRVKHSEVSGKKVRVCTKCSASLDKEYAKAVKKETKATKKAETVAEKKTTTKTSEGKAPIKTANKEKVATKAKAQTKVSTVRKTVSNSGK